jgi:hypothetical protein
MYHVRFITYCVTNWPFSYDAWFLYERNEHAYEYALYMQTIFITIQSVLYRISKP